MLLKSRALLPSLIFIGLLSLFAFNSPWQGLPVVEKVLYKLKIFQQRYPQEKVYLHLDKPYYAAGEDIWFKVYLVQADTHAPSQLSQVLYVELINAQDSIYSRLALNLQAGTGHGDFAVPDTVAEGLYRIRAYTSWMQNFDEAYFFHQNVTIFNPRLDDLAPSLAFIASRLPAGDSVLVNMVLKNAKEEPLGETDFFYTTSVNQQTSGRRKGLTDAAGQAQLRFFLPNRKPGQNTQLALTVVEGKRQTRKNFTIPLPSDNVDVQFFPEGGQLVSGVWATVGFKAVDSNGLGVEVTGTVHDQTGKKVTEFSSLKYGMGRFGFFPEKGKSYEARIKTRNSPEKKYALPPAQSQGVVITLDNTSPDSVRIKAFLVGYAAGSPSRPKSLSFVGQSRGQAFFSGHSASLKDLLIIKVPKKLFPAGIAQFTIFSETGEPLAERLAFINHQQHLQISLTPDKALYKPREKVRLQVQAKDQAGNPVVGTFSLAVTDAQQVERNLSNGSILSNLLLTSDLRGYVEEPGYYFSSAEPEVTLALDNLMLTQGWRRFVWKDLLSDQYPQITSPLEKSLTVSGTVLKLNGKTEPHALLTVLGLSKPGFVILDSANEEGKFAVAAPLADSTRIAVQARTQKGKSGLEVVLDTGVPVALVRPQVPYAPTPMPLSQMVRNYVQTNRDQLRLDQLAGKSILLNSVEIRGRKQRVETEDRLRSGLYGPADVTLKADALPVAMDLISALAGRVAGLQVIGGEISMRGAGTPLFLLDGMPIDADFIRTISMTEVEKIEILKPGPSAAIYGMQGGNGVVAVSLKRGGSGAPITTTRYRGMAVYNGIRYHAARQFYMPHYDQPNTVEQPDLRTTLYWNPTVQTDATGTAEVSFFCADAITTYHAQLEGLSFAGALGKATATMQVK